MAFCNRHCTHLFVGSSTTTTTSFPTTWHSWLFFPTLQSPNKRNTDMVQNMSLAWSNRMFYPHADFCKKTINLASADRIGYRAKNHNTSFTEHLQMYYFTAFCISNDITSTSLVAAVNFREPVKKSVFLMTHTNARHSRKAGSYFLLQH